MNNFKITALGALATIGLASAAIAQPKVDHQPDRAQGAQQQERGEMQGDMSGMEMSGMMAMMNDPEMRAEMMEMMRNCNEMMKKKQEQMSQGEEG
ncbi:hypothetical protein NCF85_13210 [Qipengyuania citrea]|jgi:hypothetical protein|uniref:Pentapeptide MXKDX repeat protein n=1 Tax=Qipengyuania citrea TaxID=225971 RepID=A0ABY4UAH2_9SPHN|nr:MULTISPECIES: hypothetical protein [Sphingomonadales]MAP69251.1 hypothetical protein [Erythrobacteraceae bacterium]MBL4897769.1 hypothetical protein [Erythrobacter sp.]MEC7953349.1 hypothetical protein [Pseudomonadota bacterium]QPL40478.1 hypothetical protein IT881_04400 [Erythrobacter sp. A30-3]KPM24294.1 hypothetical protein AAJ72_00465 [Citromicrobium sp. RCC1885]|tara:strand:+ start:950 stop:1234 length:285 start_codon:yes stop_codon:yes gene_type:complete